MRGYIFNLPVAKKVKRFCDDIDKAKREFFKADTIHKESEDK